MKITEVEVEGYEKVIHGLDDETGLDAYVAVHDTTLGPGCGGLRIWPYDHREDALTDVLRLAEGMTYKSAIARTGLGGGKAVMIGAPGRVRRPETMRAMGRLIDSLDGLYITAEDVNTRVVDLEHLAEETRWVSGLSKERGGSGNPSPVTGKGIYIGMIECLEEVFGSKDPAGKHVAFQGAGAVAQTTIGLLVEAGAKVTIADINPERIEQVRRAHGDKVNVVDADAIYDVACDIFSPCALGASINDDTIPRLNCKIVAGAANNQLAETRHGVALQEHDILYAPDFVINAGGIINIGVEFIDGGYDEAVAMERVNTIDDALRATFRKAREEKIATAQAAVDVAKQIIAEAQ